MNCREFRRRLDDFLVDRPDEALEAAMVEHSEDCLLCASEYAAAEKALASLRLSHQFPSPPHLKERIMAEITATRIGDSRPVVVRSWPTGLRRPALCLVPAAAILVLVTLFWQFNPREGNPTTEAFGLLSRALAAEEALFTGDKIVLCVNEIVVKPVADPTLAVARWFPLMAIDATGKPRFHQLTLAADPGKDYTVEDRVWYDSATRRFIRLLTVDGKPIFANSFDGEAVYSLEVGGNGSARVVRHPIVQSFKAPESLAAVLGITAGLPISLEKMKRNKGLISDAGTVTLDDGSKGRLIKAGLGDDSPDALKKTLVVYTVREDDNTIARIEFRVNEESLFVVRRVKTENVEEAEVRWNLVGIERQASGSVEKARAGILRDMIQENIAVKQMAQKAGFQTYIFKKAPSWAEERQITDILDVVSPPKRMFAISYRAHDRRHVVLMQSPSYNKMLGPFTKPANLVYTSPNGIKVLSGPRDKWLAGILLRSARAVIKDSPADDRTGYLLETPSGTFPVLAINGKITEDELHGLIDSLIPVRESSAESR